MIEIEGEHTTAIVQGDEGMFDEAFFRQVQEIVDHEAFTNDIVIQPYGHAGAGRRGSRRWAYRQFDVEQLEEELGDVHNMNDKEEVLDEIPSAYKDTEDILKYLEETAKVEEKLTLVLNMKRE